MVQLRNQQTVTVTGQMQQLIGPNARRVALIISSPEKYPVYISFTGSASPTNGLPIWPLQPWIVLDCDWIGEALIEHISAYCAGGTEVIGIVEVME